MVEQASGKKRIRVEALRATVRRVLTDPSFADNAARAGERLRVMEEHLKRHASLSDSERHNRYNCDKCDNCDNRDKPDWKDTRSMEGQDLLHSLP